MCILSAAPGSGAANTSPGPARADIGHYLSTPEGNSLPSPTQQWEDGVLPSDCWRGGSGRRGYLSWKWTRMMDLAPWLWMSEGIKPSGHKAVFCV